MLNIPQMTGGTGRKDLTAFYRDHFIFRSVTVFYRILIPVSNLKIVTLQTRRWKMYLGR
jgi:hypothetical protein